MANGISYGKGLNRFEVVEFKEWFKPEELQSVERKRWMVINFNISPNPYSVQECLNSKDVTTCTSQASNVIILAHACGKQIDLSDAISLFTIENNRKESDCMQSAD